MQWVITEHGIAWDFPCLTLKLWCSCSLPWAVEQAYIIIIYLLILSLEFVTFGVVRGQIAKCQNCQNWKSLNCSGIPLKMTGISNMPKSNYCIFCIQFMYVPRCQEYETSLFQHRSQRCVSFHVLLSLL